MAGVNLAEGILLLVDKPLEWTSFDVVNKLRYALKIKKIGHAGTLDPLATGLLVIGVGKFTKKLNELQGLDKVYEGIFEIGKTTPSYDLETEFDSETDASHIGEAEMLQAASKLTGPQNQIPPAFSAIKVKGERAYHKARNNENVKLDPRAVVVYQFDVVKIDGTDVHFKIKCSKGTYIRSIARDFGDILGVGAYLKKLRRTEIGSYSVNDAQSLEEVISQYRSADN